MHKHTAAVLGASGYAGGELLRYLQGHPWIEVAWATADRNAGKTVGEVFGHLIGLSELELAPTDVEAVPGVDIAFLALPHGSSADIGAQLSASGVKVVDIAADWRLHDAAAYEAWYGWTHPAPDALSDWVYGLPELHRDTLAGADAVANPGCYPTAAVLALAPALAAGVIEPSGIVVDAASGVSGAGRKIDAEYLFSELDASFKAYGVGKHRHTPEIEQELTAVAGTEVLVTFTPHLVPMTRGLLATCYAKASAEASGVWDALATAYKGEPFVHVLPLGTQPATKHVSGSNHALVGVDADPRTGVVVITCAIDNLGKGAAGQAIQNANLMLGLDEAAGLGSSAVYP